VIEYYPAIKLLHMSCAWLSISGFLLRGCWSLLESPLLRHPLARKIPITIDTLLLLSALAMATLSGQWPLQQGWLTAKLLALLVYILLGMVALHWGKTRAQRGLGVFAAVVVFVYILGVATQRTPLPWVSGF
jgi:uncharacterized membrane protein SirB2